MENLPSTHPIFADIDGYLALSPGTREEIWNASGLPGLQIARFLPTMPLPNVRLPFTQGSIAIRREDQRWNDTIHRRISIEGNYRGRYPIDFSLFYEIPASGQMQADSLLNAPPKNEATWSAANNAMLWPLIIEMSRLMDERDSLETMLRDIAQRGHNVFQSIHARKHIWPQYAPSVYETPTKIVYDPGKDGVSTENIRITNQPPFSLTHNTAIPKEFVTVERYNAANFGVSLWQFDAEERQQSVHILMRGAANILGTFTLGTLSLVSYEIETPVDAHDLKTIGGMLQSAEHALPLPRIRRFLRQHARHFFNSVKDFDRKPLPNDRIYYDKLNGHQIDFPMS